MKNGSTQTPVLYNHYAGHDDNRDFYMAALPESTAITKIQYREWYPQIVYNHHQTGPAGTVMFAAPFRDPYNYYQHPQAIAAIDTVGSLLQERMMMEGKPGVTTRKGAPYSTWFNGGLRTTAHFHNMIGILTETIGNPTPHGHPVHAGKQIGDSNIWMPIKPQDVWHFRQSIEYSITANRAFLDYASRYREKLLYDIYRMGKDEIRVGQPRTTGRSRRTRWRACRPNWSPRARPRCRRFRARPRRSRTAAAAGAAAGAAANAGGGGRRRRPRPIRCTSAMTSKETARSARVHHPVRPAGLRHARRSSSTRSSRTASPILRATAPFTVAGKQYPANSYVVKTAQAFRPHVMDMFEPQDHPDDIPYPGGPPTRAVRFDRVHAGVSRWA